MKVCLLSVCTLFFVFLPQAYSYETVQVPAITSATCGDLAEISFWAATAHLSKKDDSNLVTVKQNASKANNLRPGIPMAIIDKAELYGVTSHGNAGEGNSNLDAARKDAIVSATITYEMCLDGRIMPNELKEQSAADLKINVEMYMNGAYNANRCMPIYSSNEEYEKSKWASAYYIKIINEAQQKYPANVLKADKLAWQIRVAESTQNELNVKNMCDNLYKNRIYLP